MSGQTSKEEISTSSTCTDVITTASSGGIHPKQRIAQDFLLIWLDATIVESTDDYQNTLAQLRSVIDDVKIFTKWDEAIGFLTEVVDRKVFLLVEGTMGQQIIPRIHDIAQLDRIYLFGGNESEHEQWTKDWSKIQGIHTKIEPICEALKLTTKQYNQDSIAISFVSTTESGSSQTLDELEPSFMYTQIFKEILLEMEHNEQFIKDFVQYWRLHSTNDTHALKVIDEFERTYRSDSAIRWYTRERFLFEMVNRALRTLEGDIIINMGFFLRDLHEQIQQLYQEQIGNYHGKSFIVYRGQGLSNMDFEKLVDTKGGLLSFNNFLSTSTKREVSFLYAESVSMNSDKIGILFKITIDPSVSSTPFASIGEVSHFREEDEILFSMHTVFRIGEIKKINNNDSLYEVDLKLTADDDQQLRTLTECIRKEVVGRTGWVRLGTLLLKLSQFNKAEELYNILLKQTSDVPEKAFYYDLLGSTKTQQHDYEKAIEYYEKALEIIEKILPENDPSLATTYNNIGMLYNNMGDYSKALSFYEKALELDLKTVPPNPPSVATSYNNIAGVYHHTGEYQKALSFYEKALEIEQKTLPPNHPSLATSYNNIGMVYDKTGEYSKALSFYEKALEIFEKTLPQNHPSLATSYNNSGAVYDNMGEYSKALSFYEKALEIRQKTLPPNHPELATSYNNIGIVYKNMGQYKKALSFYEKALEIRQKTLPPNHPDFAQSYNNIGRVYDNMGEYSKALSFYEKTLQIYQKTLPQNHPSLAISYNNIGSVYDNMGEYSKALSFYEKALEIRQKTLLPNHPDFGQSYNNIGLVYNNMGKYSKALSFYEKALEIFKKTLPPNHPSLATSYNNIGMVYDKMGEYSKALSVYEKALEIKQKTLPPNHPSLATSYNNIAAVYHHTGEYSKALSYFERALGIFQGALPDNHPSIQTVLKSIEIVKKNL